MLNDSLKTTTHGFAIGRILQAESSNFSVSSTALERTGFQVELNLDICDGRTLRDSRALKLRDYRQQRNKHIVETMVDQRENVVAIRTHL